MRWSSCVCGEARGATAHRRSSGIAEILQRPSWRSRESGAKHHGIEDRRPSHVVPEKVSAGRCCMTIVRPPILGMIEEVQRTKARLRGQNPHVWARQAENLTPRQLSTPETQAARLD